MAHRVECYSDLSDDWKTPKIKNYIFCGNNIPPEMYAGDNQSENIHQIMHVSGKTIFDITHAGTLLARQEGIIFSCDGPDMIDIPPADSYRVKVFLENLPGRQGFICSF